MFLTSFAKINFAVIIYWVQPRSMVNTAVFLSSATVTRILWFSSARTWQGIVYQGEYSSEQKLWWVCSGFYENLRALLVLLCILDRTIIIKQLTIQCSFKRVDLLKNKKGGTHKSCEEQHIPETYSVGFIMNVMVNFVKDWINPMERNYLTLFFGFFDYSGRWFCHI